ncbi:hypothetical protein DMUE_1594 [Dictyocoela muelleri]|nr:hypothetical protein DMUE_1594 [Dictyocoela muelleri]
MYPEIFLMMLSFLSFTISKTNDDSESKVPKKSKPKKPTTSAAKESTNNDSDGKLDVKIEDGKNVSVKTSDNWNVDKFYLKSEADDKVVKDLTDQFNSEFNENRGKKVTVDYGDLKNAEDKEKYYFSLIDSDENELKSSTFKYDKSKGELVKDDNSDNDDSDGWGWGYYLLIFAVGFLIVGGILYFVSRMSGDS